MRLRMEDAFAPRHRGAARRLTPLEGRVAARSIAASMGLLDYVHACVRVNTQIVSPTVSVRMRASNLRLIPARRCLIDRPRGRR